MNIYQELFSIIQSRKNSPAEGSYTAYLFREGIDKILKKCGEEIAEVIIAAKNQSKPDIVNEICDAIYHLLILCANQGIEWQEVEAELKRRMLRSNNLKEVKNTDKDT